MTGTALDPGNLSESKTDIVPPLFFFFFKVYLFIYVFIYFWLHRVLVAVLRLLSSYGTQAW